MLRTFLKHWLLPFLALAIFAGCESIASDTDGTTSLPVGVWERLDGLSEETMNFSKDGAVVLDSLDAAGAVRYLGTWVGSTASGTVVWKEFSTPTSSDAWSEPKPLLKLVTCPYVIQTGELIMTFPEGKRRFAMADTTGY
ncbi:MAG: hypothetical protein IPK50_10010 [Fibrobacterota bacterium]|nr:hypothetical protein [Fibrobacterota bacterium]QQS07212.1 MAG: hypothetical protein IPK50_10010 [Fibrobacterota bacterium]